MSLDISFLGPRLDGPIDRSANMKLARVAFARIAKTLFLFSLIAGTIGCFLISYSYLSGDRTDREEMQTAVSQAASYLRLPASVLSEKPKASLSSLNSKR